MKPFRRALPSLNALMTFEAAARLESFTAAARELGVTQAAVSRQVHLLEQELGVLLFQRSHRKVRATAAGSLLAGTLESCFEKIRDAADLIRQPMQPDTVTLGATVAFSHFWLLPRIASFRDQQPEATIRIVTQDSPFDLTSGTVDIVFRFGLEAPRGGAVLASASDLVYPVASPAFVERSSRPRSIAGLRQCPLIASEAPEPTWIDWAQWFALADGSTAPTRPALRFTNYTDCVQATLAGYGVALGWDFLLRRQIEAGQLVRLCDIEVRPEAKYQLIVPEGRRRTSATAAFIDWARQEFDSRGEPISSVPQP